MDYQLVSNKDLIDSKMQGVFAVTGGGTLIFDDLLGSGGGSAYFLEGRIPYSKQSLEELIFRDKKNKACSQKTARQMALWAFYRAQSLSQGPVFGIGLTCSLKTENERPDRVHRVCAAYHTASKTEVFEIYPGKNLTRLDQETLSSQIAYTMTKRACGYDAWFAPGDSGIRESAIGDPGLFGKVLYSSNYSKIKCLIPGSFNPPHAAHYAMYEQMCNRFGPDHVYFEISVKNVDKPGLDFIDIRERSQIKGNVLFTNAATFAEKASLFPDTFFAMGYDTWARIIDPAYPAALGAFSCHGNKVIVFDRNGQSVNPQSFSTMERVPFNMNISSTELRG